MIQDREGSEGNEHEHTVDSGDAQGDWPSAHRRFDELRAAGYRMFYPPIELDAQYPTHNQDLAHAYIVVGTETIFLCHQIMGFMEGHNYELVLEAELPAEIKAGMLADREERGVTHFLGGNRDSSGEHTIPAIKSGRVTRFTADIWDYFPHPDNWGHHWPWPDEPPPRYPDVEVTIRSVVHCRHVDMNVTNRRFESYLLFGKGEEAHLYHSVVDQPDYDHVATLASKPEWIQQDQLEAGVMVSMRGLPWKRHSGLCRNPLPDGRHAVLFHGIESYRDPHGMDPMKRVPVPPYAIDVAHTWWFSTRVVNFFPEDPCPVLEDIPTPR